MDVTQFHDLSADIMFPPWVVMFLYEFMSIRAFHGVYDLHEFSDILTENSPFETWKSLENRKKKNKIFQNEFSHIFAAQEVFFVVLGNLTHFSSISPFALIFFIKMPSVRAARVREASRIMQEQITPYSLGSINLGHIEIKNLFYFVKGAKKYSKIFFFLKKLC